MIFRAQEQLRKTYGYLLTEEKDCPPFFKRYTWQTGRKLDISKMEKAAEVLSGTHDFTSFRGNNSVPASPVRTIHDIRIIKSITSFTFSLPEKDSFTIW